jgi:hypothetical protein
MATINLTDQLGLDVGAEVGDTSALLKYFKQLPSLRLDSLDLSKIGGLTLDQPALKALSTGLSFNDPVQLGDGAATFTIGAGAHAKLRVITDPDDLPGDEGDSKPPQQVCYVSFTVEATASVGISATAGELTFGATPSTTVAFSSYTRFPDPAEVTLIDAVRQTVSQMAIPAKSKDLADLAPGQIATVDVSGELQLSASANLLAVTNPLASAALPAPLPAVSVSAGGSATVGVSFAIDTDYRIVARKLDSGAVRLGWYNQSTENLTVSANVSEGISAGFGTTDVFSQVIGAISGDAKADLKELQSAGLTEDQAEAIESAVRAAVCRKLEIAVGAEWFAIGSKSAAFLYDVVPTSLTGDSRAAIDRALGGDLTALHTPLPGITCVSSIWENAQKRGMELDVNLLGVLNYRSIATLCLAGKVMYEPASGALVIADTATADRIQTAAVNFGADADKLRHVLAESFLITAAYHGTKLIAGPVSLRCTHSFFELKDSANAGDVTRHLRTGVGLSLMTVADVALPEGIDNFGRTLFTASADYDSGLVTGMFLDGAGAPNPVELYETVGRAAIQLLVLPGGPDAARLCPASDDNLWKQMKADGQPGIPALFPGVADQVVAAIVEDYSTIRWWADTMCETAAELAKVRLWQQRNPNASPDDPDFQALRKDLADSLRQVAATTREEFGQPWGLLAMNQLAAARSGARILIASPHLVTNKQRSLAAATGE